MIDYYKWYNTERAEELFPFFLSDPRRTKSNREHETMASIYIDAMVDIIRNGNPDFGQSRAESIAWSGLQETWAYELMKMKLEKYMGEENNRKK
ncbi:hypothetical protein [Plebeiibacterium sediminum]|uniref:Uncharacterized protein n=1 Tax=Plebeiibacterium sediminum TaxID=2992112 RepID=A0AAE3M5C3_9BACT|nr:hypothetical protein [Plebeiobacterium sediminum]MCW3786955.1 hypothetical protein [Plebeiobacterium sediminum]